MLKNILKFKNQNSGMTYAELIVVIGILGVISAISIYNYHGFQGKVDIQNLSNDIALKLVEAQKSAVGGKFNSSAGANWKPSYGLYFNLSTNPKSFTYFVNLDNSNPPYSPGTNCTGECLEQVTITKGNSISNIMVNGQNGCSQSATSLSVTFTRPDLRANFNTSPATCSGITSVVIKVASPAQSTTSNITIYASGRIQIN